MENFIKKIKKTKNIKNEEITNSKDDQNKNINNDEINTDIDEQKLNKSVEEASLDISDHLFSSNEENDENNNRVKNDSLINEGNSDKSNIEDTSILEIKTLEDNKISNVESFKCNFNLLEAESKKQDKVIRISEIKSLSSYKIDEAYVICALIKSISKFRDTFRLELIDESGLIIAHTNKDDFSIGDILVLRNSSLWKFNENQVNIVDENVVNIIKESD